MGFTYQNPFFPLLLAQPYCIQKVLHEGRSVHIIKLNKNPKKQKQFTRTNIFFKKYQEKKESIHIKVLYNVDKTAQNCYKKVEELCEAAPYR